MGSLPRSAFTSLFFWEAHPTMESLSPPDFSSKSLFKRQTFSVLSSEQVAIYREPERECNFQSKINNKVKSRHVFKGS